MKLSKSVAAAAAALGLVLAPASLLADHHGEKAGKEKKEHAQKVESPEQFVKHAVEANQMELQAARMVQQRSQTPQVQQLASTIEQHHQQASQQLQQLAQQHNVQAEGLQASGQAQTRPGGAQAQAQVGAPGGAQTGAQAAGQTGDKAEKYQEKVAKLQAKTGKELDKAYLTHVVHGHEKGIKMLQECSDKFQDAPQIRTFIDRNLPAMQQHLQMAQNAARELNIEIAQQAEWESDDSAVGAPGTSETGAGQRDQLQKQDNSGGLEGIEQGSERDQNLQDNQSQQPIE